MSLVITYKFAHKDCINNKLQKSIKGKSLSEQTVLISCLEKYDEYSRAVSSAFKVGNGIELSGKIEEYLEYAKSIESLNPSLLGFASKYYSSILEEMPVLLTEVILNEYSSLKLECKHKLFVGGEDCLIRVGANPNGTPFFETKRIDFCIALYSEGLNGYVPLLGYEVKKYVDKTMFGTILETYKSLQIFRPRTRYGFISEDECRGADVIVNSPMYDNEFVLTNKHRNNSKRNPIDAAEIIKFSDQLKVEVSTAITSICNIP